MEFTALSSTPSFIEFCLQESEVAVLCLTSHVTCNNVPRKEQITIPRVAFQYSGWEVLARREEGKLPMDRSKYVLFDCA